MAKYRKLGRTSSQRKALLRNQVTALLNNGKIVTTEAKAKEVKKIAEHLIALAVKEKDNYETVTVSAKVPVKDKDGKTFTVDCDSVILSVGYNPQPLAPKGRHVHVIGDAAQVGNLRTVIWGAWDVCMKL